MKEEEWDKENLHTVYGTFKDNIIYADDGDEIECITYGSVRKEINEQEGFFILRWSNDIDKWIVFNYII